MWTFSTEEPGDRVLRFTSERGGKPAAFAEVIRAWRADAAFRAAFNAALADAPFDVFRWETPGVSTTSDVSGGSADQAARTSSGVPAGRTTAPASRYGTTRCSSPSTTTRPGPEVAAIGYAFPISIHAKNRP